MSTLGIIDINDHREVYLACRPVSSKWRYFGARLGVLESTIRVIEADHRGEDVERCMSVVIDKWLRRPVGEVVDDDGVLPTWRNLCAALAHIDIVLAEGIALEHGLSITTSQDRVVGYTRKRPQLNEMLGLLRDKSGRWYEIGAAFGVSLNERELTRKSMNDNGRLEHMLYTWLQTSEQSNTWEEFIRILKDRLGYHDVVKNTNDFLLKQQVPLGTLETVEKEIKEVLGQMKISTFLIHGAPRVGKTCVKRLVLNKPAKKQDSTRLVEDPVRAISTTKIVCGDQISLEEMDKKKIIEVIGIEILNAKRKRKRKAEERVASIGIECIPNRDKPTDQTTTNVTPAILTTSSRNTTEPTKKLELKYLSEIASNLDSVNPNSPSLFDCHHVHLVDSGGQQQFSDLLPLILLSQSHHHIVVIRLDKLLHDKAENCVQIDGKKYILPESLSLTNYQLIERVCQLASGSRSRVFIIGTHLDCENKEEPLSKKIELLEPLLTKYKHNLSFNEMKEPIFAVNAMTENCDERKKFAATLQKAILSAPILVDGNNARDGIPVPLRWIILEIELSRRPEQAGVLHMDDIREVADALKITRDDLPKALEFFKKLAIHYYYPEVLPNIVFTSVYPISSMLSNIVEASFKRPEYTVDEDQERLQNNGELTVNFLNQLSHKLQIIDHFQMEDFIRLMHYLRVLFDIDSHTYLIPSLLPVETTAIDSSYLREPLLCYWLNELGKDRILPQSFFNALIVELLRRDEVELNRAPDCKNSRSAFVFNVTLPTSDEYQVCVVDKVFWLEIFVEEYADYIDCRSILNRIQTCTEHVLEQLHLSSLGNLQYGIRCRCCSDNKSHPSKCTKRKEQVFCCVQSGKKWKETSKERLFWFPSELQSSKRPELNDVYTLLKGKSADWDKIGRALGVSLDKRKSLEKNGSYDNSRRLEEVIYIWLETSEQSNVTWDVFIRILKGDELQYNDVVKKTEELLRSLQ